MSVLRLGSTKKFADNWSNIFGAEPTGRRTAGKRGKAKGKIKAKAGKKSAAKPSSGKTTAAPRKAGKATPPVGAARAKAERPASSNAAPPNGKKRKAKPAPAPVAVGVGSEEAKKSAAKRKTSTGKRKPQPLLQQKELF